MQIDLLTSDRGVDYRYSQQQMHQMAIEIAAGKRKPTLWLLQHPQLYSIGRSGNLSDILSIGEIPLYHTDRGGKVTYHGPGQSIVYAMLPLLQLYGYLDLHRYISDLQHGVMAALQHYGLHSYLMPGKIGVWCNDKKGTPSKIAAVGVKVCKGITMHGVSVNVNPDLTKFAAIIPCGIKEYGVTSCQQQGLDINVTQWQQQILRTYQEIFHLEL